LPSFPILFLEPPPAKRFDLALSPHLSMRNAPEADAWGGFAARCGVRAPAVTSGVRGDAGVRATRESSRRHPYAGSVPMPPPDPVGTCLVTGASSGIGAEIARELARRGYGLTLTARRVDRLEALADELATGSDQRFEVIQADLAEEEDRTALAASIGRLGLHVDVLVNNAGSTTLGSVVRATRRAELSMVRTDVEAIVDLCCLFAPGMASRRRGAILNTASTAAFQPLPWQAGYGASKAFVLSYSHALRAELRGYGVTVTALCPGPVATGFAAAAGAHDEELAGTLPRFLWRSADDVAKAGVDALTQDKAVVIPGLANRIGAIAATLTPDAVVASAVALLRPVLRPRR
jgi:uncharacterized protein